MYILIVVATASMLVRLRQAGEVERQQIKWFAYAATVAVVGALLTYVVSEATGAWWVGQVGLAILVIGFLGIPVTISIAILRYRLYEIDLIINRTFVYGLLTGALVLIYFGSIVLLQEGFYTLTGEGSQLSVVASTLISAALFQPLRWRVQAFIDRRFYRRKYDAAKTLEAFGSKLKDETDLDELCEDLVLVVRETMQPKHVSLWLSPPKVKR